MSWRYIQRPRGARLPERAALDFDEMPIGERVRWLAGDNTAAANELLAEEIEKLKEPRQKKRTAQRKKRGNKKDRTRQIDQVVHLLLDDPELAERYERGEISKSRFADMAECDPSVLSRPEAGAEIAKAIARARRSARDARIGHCDSGHQADGVYEEDWASIDNGLE